MANSDAFERWRILRAAAALLLVAVLALFGLPEEAMAACSLSATPGVVVDCTGASVLPVPGIPGVSIINGNTSPQIGVRLTTSGTELTNDVDITSQVTDITGPPNRNNFNVYGIGTPNIGGSVWSILNNGNVSAVHNGVGQLAAIAIIGDAEEASVVNAGTLSITRGPITFSTNSAASLQVGGVNLANAAAYWIQEEENESASIENLGTISASGKVTAGAFSRGAFLGVENEEGGKIIATGIGSVAVSAHNGTDQEDEDDIHKFFIGNTIIENEGLISGEGGAIQVVDANGLRYMASRVPEGTGNGYDPLTITSQVGRRDSTIVNSGTIDGNIYLGGGNHVLVNTDEGEITGDIDVDQRRDFNYTVNNPNSFPLEVFRAGGDDDDGGEVPVFSPVADFLAAFPDHYFQFDNAAPLTGNLSVHTNVTGGPDHTSTVELLPHVLGSGPGSSFNDPSKNIGYIDGTLAIGIDGVTANGRNITQSTIATTTTVTPVLDHFVRDGDWYMVARNLYGDDLPMLDPEESFLVDWKIAKNDNDSLVIGSTVVDARTIKGITKPAANSLNTLLQSDSDDEQLGKLGLAFEQLTKSKSVRIAAEQLKPEVNGAQIQIPFLFSSMVTDRIRNRLVQFENGPKSNNYSRFPEPNRLAGPGTPYGWDSGPQVFDEDDPAIQGYRPNAGWGELVGSRIEQGTVDGVSGYDADLWGLVFGYDGALNATTRAGVAFGYSNTDIDDTDLMAANSTVLNSYLGIVYGMWKPGPFYLNGTLGLGLHRYDSTRVLTALKVDSVEEEEEGGDDDAAGGEQITPNANGKFDGIQGLVSIDGGYPIPVGRSIFIPVASLSYNNLDQDAHAETGLGGMALKYGGNVTDSLRSGLGARLLVPLLTNTVGELRAVWQHEFLDTAQVVTASFVAGSGSFVAPGPQPGRDTADLGAGLVMRSGGGLMSLTLDYDATLQEDFVAHTGLARLRFNF